MALAQFGTRFKIGFHHAQLIEYFLDRATNPTFEKLSAHYPDHPRPGAPELHPTSDFGRCIINALNIKRGYWRLPRLANSNQAPSGISPFGSTPESVGQGSGSNSTAGTSAGSGFTNNNNKRGDDNSPNSHPNPFITPNIGQGQSMSTNFGLGGGGGGPNSEPPIDLAALWSEVSSTGPDPGLDGRPDLRPGPATKVYAWRGL